MVPHALQYEARQQEQGQQLLYTVNEPKYYGGSPQERESAYLYLCYIRTYLSIDKKKNYTSDNPSASLKRGSFL